MSKTIDIHDSSVDLATLVELARGGDEVILSEGDKPLAKLTPISPADTTTGPRIMGLHAGSVWISDDFDDPLPDEFWLGQA